MIRSMQKKLLLVALGVTLLLMILFYSTKSTGGSGPGPGPGAAGQQYLRVREENDRKRMMAGAAKK